MSHFHEKWFTGCMVSEYDCIRVIMKNLLKKLNVGIVTGEMNRDSDRDMGKKAGKDIALTIGTSRVRVALRAQWTPRDSTDCYGEP